MPVPLLLSVEVHVRKVMISRPRVTLLLLLMVAALAGAIPAAAQQKFSSQDMDRSRRMLDQLRKDLHEFYYDSTFGGVDIEKNYRAADSAIQQAPNMNYAMGIIAQFLADLKDSHTSFQPPSHVARVDYGFALQIVGDSVFVIMVKKGSDAEAKGLKRGDVVISFDKMKTTRASLPVIQYVYYRLNPRPALQLTVRSPGETEFRKVDINAKITEGQRVIDLTDVDQRRRIINEMEEDERAPTHFYRTIGDSVLVWRMPSFVYGDQEGIDEMIERAKKFRGLIFDLRNNGGGSVDTELYLLGKFFPQEIKVLTMRERDSTALRVAKPTAKVPYGGMLVVLINSNSASASEIFARVMQLEGRGFIVGDRSMGAVITSRFYSRSVGGVDRRLSYGASISIADVIMPDGNRLENVGVMPDARVLPTGADIAARRDPQMAKALELLGVVMTPEEAARLSRSGPKTAEP